MGVWETGSLAARVDSPCGVATFVADGLVTGVVGAFWGEAVCAKL